MIDGWSLVPLPEAIDDEASEPTPRGHCREGSRGDDLNRGSAHAGHDQRQGDRERDQPPHASSTSINVRVSNPAP